MAFTPVVNIGISWMIRESCSILEFSWIIKIRLDSSESLVDFILKE